MKPVLVGVLLLAHGGDPSWNKQAESICAEVAKTMPCEVALGMADTASMQKGLEALAAKKVKKAAVVPLFVSSRSEVLDQTRFLLGLSEKPSEVFRDAMAANPHAAHMGHAYTETRVKAPIPVAMTAALDDDELVAEILLSRAKTLSKDPKNETIFLVGHGPVDDKANERWLETMRALGRRLQAKGKFADVEVATIRDDSPAYVKQDAKEDLRGRIRAASKSTRVIVIPHLIARGGIESHVHEAVEGLPVAWSGETLAPHPALAKWVLKRAHAAEK